MDVQGHARAQSAQFKGQVVVAGNLEALRSVIARTYYCELL